MTGRSTQGEQSVNADADKRAPDSFSVRHLRVQFLIAVTMAKPDLWADLERNYFQEYLRLEKEQYELQLQEEERDWEAGIHPMWAPLVDPDLKRPGQNDPPREMLEQRVHEELEEESHRALDKYDRVYGGEEEKETDWSRFGKPITGPGFFLEGSLFIDLDGRDPAARELRESIRQWLQERGLGEYWCADILLGVMARQKKILDKAHLRSRRQRDDAAWQLAWKKRFHAFIDDLKETLTKCGVEAILTPSLSKAWKAEWMRIGQDSHFKDSPVPQPPGYPLWLPDFERKKEYLRAIESAAKRELQPGTLLSSATVDLRDKLIRRIMKKAQAYCQQVDEARKAQMGVQREKAKPEQLKHIVWAVQYQVMKIDLKEIAERSIADEAAAGKAIRAILKTIKLFSRGEAGRRKGQKDSEKSRRRILRDSP